MNGIQERTPALRACLDEARMRTAQDDQLNHGLRTSGYMHTYSTARMMPHRILYDSHAEQTFGVQEATRGRMNYKMQQARWCLRQRARIERFPAVILEKCMLISDAVWMLGDRWEAELRMDRRCFMLRLPTYVHVRICSGHH